MGGASKVISKQQINQLYFEKQPHTYNIGNFVQWHCPQRKGAHMAYRCILAPSRECDGCMECEDRQDYDPRWDSEYDNDDEQIEREEY